MNSQQKEFDIVAAHLHKQGRPAKSDNGPSCFYRKETEAHGVLSCAVGCRIPDSRYNNKMEMRNSTNMVGLFGKRLRKELTAYAALFRDLQRAHDECNQEANGSFNIKDLNKRLTDVARAHNLTYVPQGE